MDTTIAASDSQHCQASMDNYIAVLDLSSIAVIAAMHLHSYDALIQFLHWQVSAYWIGYHLQLRQSSKIPKVGSVLTVHHLPASVRIRSISLTGMGS